MVLIKGITSQIKDILKKNPQGMTVTQIARKTGINRNTVGRYLENLLVSGQVEMRRFGMKKIYALSQRVALSSILSISSELVVQLDSSLRIIYANEPFLKLVETDNNDILGKNIEYTPVSIVFDELFTGFIENIKEGVIGKEWSGEFVLSTKDIHLFCRIVPTVFDDGRKGVSVILEDITSQKKAEDAKKESEEKYRTLIDRANDGICVIQDKIIKMCNRYITEFWGGSIEEILGRPFTDFIHPDALSEVLDRYNQRMAGENPPPIYQTIIKRKDGSRFYAELNAGIISYEGKPANLIIIRDMNERKKVEAALRESEDLYRTLAEASNDLIFVIGRNDHVEYVNSYTAAMINRPINQIIGSPRTGLFSPEILTSQKTELDSVFATGSSVRYSSPLPFNGRIYWYDHILTPLKDPNNNVRSVLGISRDITERKVSEAALFASEKRFQSLVEMLPQSIWECDDRGNVTFVNQRTYEMYGYDYEDVEKGMTIWQTIHPDDRERVLGDFIRASMEEPSEFPVFHEFMSIRKDGSTFPLITYHVPIVHENKITGMRGIGIDISERKRAEDALKESEERFRLLVESVPFGISFITSTGTIEYTNPAFEKICGYTQKEFPDLTIWGEKVFPDTEYREKIFSTWQKQIRALTDTNLQEDKIFRIHCRDGKDKDILFTAVFFPNGKELVIVDDITEWKRSEDNRESGARLNPL
jgi:PAS domain S-box-containing protein